METSRLARSSFFQLQTIPDFIGFQRELYVSSSNFNGCYYFSNKKRVVNMNWKVQISQFKTYFDAKMSSFLRYCSAGSECCLQRYSATCLAGNSVSQTYPKSRARWIDSPAIKIKCSHSQRSSSGIKFANAYSTTHQFQFSILTKTLRSAKCNNNGAEMAVSVLKCNSKSSFA